MKRFLTLTFISLVTISCSSDDAPIVPVDPTDPNSNIVNVSGAISSDATWTSNNIYVLNYFRYYIKTLTPAPLQILFQSLG